MLSWVEQEKSFIISGPGLRTYCQKYGVCQDVTCSDCVCMHELRVRYKHMDEEKMTHCITK